jgi:hypothetical protein
MRLGRPEGDFVLPTGMCPEMVSSHASRFLRFRACPDLKIAALHLFQKVREDLGFNRISVRFPTVTGADAKLFSKLKKGHSFCPFSSASDQSRNLAETGFSFCVKLGGEGVWR